MNRKSVKYVVTGMSWEGNFKFDEDGKIEDTYGYANERTWKLESFHIKTRYRHKITAETDENGGNGKIRAQGRKMLLVPFVEILCSQLIVFQGRKCYSDRHDPDLCSRSWYEI